MSGNKEGALKTIITNKKLYGEDYYKKIGKLGGMKSRNCGFGSSKVGHDGLSGKERARTAGSKGGKISKRGKAKTNKHSLRSAR